MSNLLDFSINFATLPGIPWLARPQNLGLSYVINPQAEVASDHEYEAVHYVNHVPRI